MRNLVNYTENNFKFGDQPDFQMIFKDSVFVDKKQLLCKTNDSSVLESIMLGASDEVIT